MNSGYEYREVVGAGAAGATLLDHLARHYRHSTRDEWRERIEAGRVLLDGEAAGGSALLRAGQSIVWRRPPWNEPEAPLAWALLYRDDDLLGVAKPAGLPTLPGGGFLEHTLFRRVQRSHPDAVPVHRLDRGASGVVLFARRPRAAAWLAALFREGRAEKVYRALVEGHPGADRFEVGHPIAGLHMPDGRRLFVAAGSVPPGGPAFATGRARQALTHVRVLERRADGTTLVEARPVTGRPHQIRIHLAAAGHPLVGDPFYAVGGGVRPDAGRPGATGFHLHAAEIAVPASDEGMRLVVACNPPRILSTTRGGEWSA
ncbi:MAG TPA: RluA family pseudouridine synthase [Candidatus Polarisedimenticolia bacterium]|nr:RluA family pseudouridine synthase [Candidatus Polarisedimenticolia bacterium]